jgi:hypothetical protein
VSNFHLSTIGWMDNGSLWQSVSGVCESTVHVTRAGCRQRPPHAEGQQHSHHSYRVDLAGANFITVEIRSCLFSKSVQGMLSYQT